MHVPLLYLSAQCKLIFALYNEDIQTWTDARIIYELKKRIKMLLYTEMLLLMNFLFGLGNEYPQTSKPVWFCGQNDNLSQKRVIIKQTSLGW